MMVTSPPYVEGDIVEFTLTYTYNPIIIKDEPFEITILRSAVLGYND